MGQKKCRETSLSAEVSAVRRRIEKWRKRRKRKGGVAMPDELWQATFALVEQFGVSPIAIALGLNHSVLKQRYENATLYESPEFIEFTGADILEKRPQQSPSETEIELYVGTERKIVIRQTSEEGMDLVALVSLLWSQEQ